MIEQWCERQLKAAVKKSGAPGAAACAGTDKAAEFTGAYGLSQRKPEPQPATAATLYDMASLTKVVATTTAAMLLWERGALDLKQPVSDFIPEPAFRPLSIWHLLTHSTGLPAYAALYKEISSADEAIKKIAAMERTGVPGERHRYSDFGFVLLGRVVSLAARDTLDAFCAREIFAPLGMQDTGYKPAEPLRARAAATENCPWRGRIMKGEVHDENAFAMGGVSGHAGLFSTAPDVAKFCQALLSGRVLKEATIQEMIRPGRVPSYPWQGLGWKLNGWMRGGEGYLPSRTAFGHTGWTGTCIWMDWDAKRYAALLSNTCHPTRSGRNNRALRQTFYIPVSRAWYPASTNAHAGLDVLLSDDFDTLRGKRTGLLTNHAAVDENGRHILDTFALGRELMLQRLFGPEHGIRGQAEAGAKVASEQAAIPVTSLYGDKKRPSADDLKGLDYFVIDLPDIGSRYYTYMATMKECLAACDEARVQVIVLDRPNPIGGTIVEGPLPEKFGSLVCCAEIPVRHGLTLGELALYFYQRYTGRRGAVPMIIRTDNWPRDLHHPQCALPWVAPSPNMPDYTTALLYVGQCLFEGVNLNEGRGTPFPFQVFGAPWLDVKQVMDLVPEAYRMGVELIAAEYTPRPIEGKVSNPKYNGEKCAGVRIELKDPQTARPFMLAVALLTAIRVAHGEQLKFEPIFDTLAGGPWLREQLQARAPLERIAGRCEEDARKFAQMRSLIYETNQQLLSV